MLVIAGRLAAVTLRIAMEMASDHLTMTAPLVELSLYSETIGEGWRAGNNVIADLHGSGTSDDIIMVCAHYDSVWTGPGAFDNGGGTAAIMERARVYNELGTKYRLRFCAFGGEQMGLWGSKGYANQLKEKHDRAEKSSSQRRVKRLENL